MSGWDLTAGGGRGGDTGVQLGEKREAYRGDAPAAERQSAPAAGTHTAGHVA